MATSSIFQSMPGNVHRRPDGAPARTGSGHDVGSDLETEDPRWRRQPGGLEEWPALFGERLRVASRTPYLYHPRSFFIDAGNPAQAAGGSWRLAARTADGARKAFPVKGLIPLEFDDRAERHGASPRARWVSGTSLRAAPPPRPGGSGGAGAPPAPRTGSGVNDCRST